MTQVQQLIQILKLEEEARHCTNRAEAQRLIRKVCSSCKGKEGGCDECLQTGYKGRLSLPELMTVDKGMRDLILESAEQKELEEYMKKHGFKTMRERGMELVEKGLTTKEEIARVTA